MCLKFVYEKEAKSKAKEMTTTDYQLLVISKDRVQTLTLSNFGVKIEEEETNKPLLHNQEIARLLGLKHLCLICSNPLTPHYEDNAYSYST